MCRGWNNWTIKFVTLKFNWATDKDKSNKDSKNKKNCMSWSELKKIDT